MHIKSTGQQLPKPQKRLIILAGSLPFPTEADGQRESPTAKECHLHEAGPVKPGPRTVSCPAPPSRSALYSKQVPLHHLLIPIRPDTDCSNPLSDRETA